VNLILRFITTIHFIGFISVFLVINPESKGQNPLIFGKKDKTFLSPENVYYFADSSNSINPLEIFSGNFDRQFKQSTINDFYAKHRNTNYWLRFQLKNTSSSTDWLVEVPDPHISKIVFFKPDNKHSFYESPIEGFDYPFSHKEYDHKNYVYHVNLPKDSIETFYFLISSEFNSSFKIVVSSPVSFNSYAQQEYILLGIFYGILLIMAIYNLFLYFNIRDKVYLFYVLYALGCALNSFSEDGLGFQYLWPNYPVMNIFVMKYTPLLLLSAFLTYSFSFLNIKQHDYILRNAIIVAYVAYVLIFLFENFVTDAYTLKNIFYLLPFILIYISSCRIYFAGYKPARFFILAYTMILISFIIFVFRVYGLVTDTLFTIYSFNIGFLTEVVILSIALGDRIRIERKEKEIYQQEVIVRLKENESLKNELITELKEKEVIQNHVNKELETKVALRTKDLQVKTDELSEFNSKLSKLVEDLNQMNIKLDVDNWQLKQQVQEEVKARLSDEELSTDKFKNLFPDESACLRYLENLKWSGGFVCKRCGHDRYMMHNSPFTRKCTSCKHVESVTADTLFHGIRIPMDKAFYIVYDTIRSGKSKTLEELSEILELNKNTIWAFRKKVQASYDALKPKSKGAVKWDDLLIK